VRKDNRKQKGGEIMPDYISRQIFKKKALDRWENEGGRIFAEQTGIFERGSPDESAGKDNAAQIFESQAADSFKWRKNKGGSI
jgi:hypothetical protein